MPRVVHFEISADDPERAVKFYQKVFGWEIKKWNGPIEYWLCMTGPKEQMGIDGGIMRRQNPQAHTENTIDVPSVDEYTKKIVDQGGKIIVPKMPVPGVGYMAYCMDTEGNVFGIMHEDATAK